MADCLTLDNKTIGDFIALGPIESASSHGLFGLSACSAEDDGTISKSLKVGLLGGPLGVSHQGWYILAQPDE